MESMNMPGASAEKLPPMPEKQPEGKYKKLNLVRLTAVMNAKRNGHIPPETLESQEFKDEMEAIALQLLATKNFLKLRHMTEAGLINKDLFSSPAALASAEGLGIELSSWQFLQKPGMSRTVE